MAEIGKYPPLPVPPAQGDQEPIDHYGMRLFAWLMSDQGCTATMSDALLELASYAGVRASAQVARADVQMADAIAELRRTLGVLLRARQSAQVAPVQVAGGTTPSRENAGPMAPLVDRPIVRPPSPSYATVTAANHRGDDVPF